MFSFSAKVRPTVELPAPGIPGSLVFLVQQPDEGGDGPFRAGGQDAGAPRPHLGHAVGRGEGGGGYRQHRDVVLVIAYTVDMFPLNAQPLSMPPLLHPCAVISSMC